MIVLFSMIKFQYSDIIIPHSNKQICTKPDGPNISGWKKQDDVYVIDNYKNRLTYTLTNINIDEIDVCIEITYKSTQTVPMQIVYQDKVSPVIYQLPKPQSGSAIETICVSDSVAKPEQNFTFGLSLNPINSIVNGKGFNITDVKLQSNSIKKHVKLVTDWKSDNIKNESWTTFPSNIWDDNSANISRKLPRF